jgi:hypothetical protein
MRPSLSLVAVLLVEQFLSTAGFTVVSAPRQTSFLVLSAEAETSEEKKPLTSQDILARARKAAGIEDPPVEEEEKIFSEALYDDLQEILKTLEKRVSGGPGSLSILEVEEFDHMTNRVLVDMRLTEDYRLNMANSAAAPQAVATLPVAPAPVAPTPAAPVQASGEKMDTSEEGEDYDGTGGLGLARGTTNTYVIPGMDEMSPEEYRTALQKSISDRQDIRKESGKYGNRGTWDYMHHLSGETGLLKKDFYEEKEEKEE